jgi:hypothetical protein
MARITELWIALWQILVILGMHVMTGSTPDIIPPVSAGMELRELRSAVTCKANV